MDKPPPYKWMDASPPPYSLTDLATGIIILSESDVDSEGTSSLESIMPPFSPHVSESDYFADSESEGPYP